MIEKMKTYIENAKTNPETTDEELLRIAEEYAEMDEEGRKVNENNSKRPLLKVWLPTEGL